MKTVAMVNNHNGCPRDTLFKLSKLLKEKERREGGREGESGGRREKEREGEGRREGGREKTRKISEVR